MGKTLQKPYPELLFASSDSAISRAINQACRQGDLRKIHSKIYTSNLVDPVEDIIVNHCYRILSHLFPGAVISHRSALEGGLSAEGYIVLTYKYSKKIELPGLTVQLVKGYGADELDTPFLENLYLASRPRAFLENMQVSRGVHAKNLSQSDIEKRLDRLCQIYGVDELKKLREEAKAVANRMDLSKEYQKLAKLIGALLGTQTAKGLQSIAAKARAEGMPYDTHRVELFANLFMALTTEPLSILPNQLSTTDENRNIAFFDAYFSNYIEGTEFEIAEAEEIIFRNHIVLDRPQDSHDILSTFNLVSSLQEMQTVPTSINELFTLLQRRHSCLMEARPEKKPGQFKDEVNRAGQTVFVAPELVKGTLLRGFEYYQKLTPGIGRALFMMFLISEVHPFSDGNGRLARIMMNAELISNNETRIIIPTVYREDYILALRSLSRQRQTIPYIRMLQRAQAFIHSIHFDNYDRARYLLEKSNAFLLPDEGKLNFP